MSKVLDILKSTGAIITDSHFVGTSGRHMPTYINKDALYPHIAETSKVCELFADKVKDLNIDVVVGPALGGIILSTWTAYHLGRLLGREVLGVYAEKTPEGGMIFTRGYEKLVSGKKVLIVEDLTTTGGSAKKTAHAVTSGGGKVAGICAMVNRNPKEVTSEYFGVPFFPLDVLEIPTYEEKDCPMCKAGVPINTSVGHGKKYLEEKNKV